MVYKLIVSGTYRDVWGNEDLCYKYPKPIIKNLRIAGTSAKITLSHDFVALLHRHPSKTLHQIEMQSYQVLLEALGPQFKANLQKIHSVDGEKDIQVCHRVVSKVNRSGLVYVTSNQLDRHIHDQVCDPFFWQKVQQLEECILDKDIPFFGISPKHMLVRITVDTYEPVLVDFKHYGTNTLPFQMLATRVSRQEKTRREFKSIYAYKPNGS